LDLRISFIGYSSVPIPFLKKGSMVGLLVASSMDECFMTFSQDFRFISVLIMCREVTKRICVAGGDPTLVESPTEPKWSPKGICISI
jgi:hypothetical protein